jgi:hypothetical protein
MRRKPLNDAQIRALPPIPKSGKKDVHTCGDGLLIANEPVVGQKPCLRFIYRYFQKLPSGQRKQQELEHPFLGEKVTMGLVCHLQARLLARHLRGDHDAYPAFLWK